MNHRPVTRLALLTLALCSWAPVGEPNARTSRPAARAQGADDAARKETLKKLVRLLNQYGSRVEGGTLMRLDARGVGSCTISYEQTPVVPPDSKAYVPFRRRTRVAVADLDPSEVKVGTSRDGATRVQFATRNGRRTIEQQLGNEPHHFGQTAYYGALSWWLTSEVAAEEVRRTLVRAIELCGR